MADPCTADTNSIDHVVTAGTLTSNLRVKTLGGLFEDAGGVYVGMDSDGGVQITSEGVSLKPQAGGGIVSDTNGVVCRLVVTAVGYVYGAADDTVVHAQAIARGSYVQIGSTLSAGLSLAPSVHNLVRIDVHWGVNYNTTIAGIETSNTFDGITLALEVNYDSLGWQALDKVAALTNNQARIDSLSASVYPTMGDSTAHTIQARLTARGEVTSATATQGHVNSSFHRGLVISHPF